MKSSNFTLVVDLTTALPEQRSSIAALLISAAKRNSIPVYWGEGAVLAQINPALADQRDYVREVEKSGLRTHVRA